jgi:DNA-binding beta-propeller fold protein YncE
MKSASVAAGLLLLGEVLAFSQTTNFFNWETPPVHPVALSPDGARLVICNLPDNRLEVFDVTSGHPVAAGSVCVGLDPVSVRFRNEDEVWIADFISDSVSIVSLSAMRVVATLDTLNEPSDIVFAGSPQRAFVSCAQPNTVQVFDPGARVAITNLVIDGNRPKAMAVSPDGNQVYVAIFESGNATTIIGSGVSLGLPSPMPMDFFDSPSDGKNPPPNSGTNFVPAINPNLPATNPPPRVSLIVKKSAAGRWMDDNHGDWTEYVSGTNAIFSGRTAGWDLPDHDLAIIDTSNFAVNYASGLMNICMDVAVNPASGKVTVIGTEALNHLRFEPVLKGIFLRVELATVDPVSLTNRASDLNPHLDYLTQLVPQTEREKSLGDPRGIVWSADGSRGYVTGMGSDNLVIINSNGQRVGAQPAIPLGQGPTGMVLDEARHRLYVLNRFAATISVVDTAAETVLETVPLFDPTPTVIKTGRKHLYDTHATSGLGQASCGSCHVDARFDRLAWDLGDPAGSIKFLTNANFGRFPPGSTNHFHPMKGPTTTQTLQDIIGHEPFHWRGDRDGLELFNPTFTNLQASASALTATEMQEFEDFLATVRFPPNPFRKFDNTLSANLPLPGHVALGRGTLPTGSPLPNGNALAGLTRFRLQGTTGCIHCHTLPAGLGTDLRWTGLQWINTLTVGPSGEHHAAYAAIERSANLPFKIQSLRNLFDKLGLDYAQTSNLAGFGFFHDGSVDTLVRFIQDGFDFRADKETADMVAFLLSFAGSDLPAGSFFDADRAPGLASKDTHAAVGRQITINSSASVPLIDTMIVIANASASRVDVVAKGFKDGLARGWFYDRTTGRFLSDRKSETLLPSELRQLAAVGSELTYTVVPRDSGKRIGVDRDEDGYFDRDELDFGSDPANALSLATNRPPVLATITNRTIFGGQALAFTVTATDPDIPVQQLTFGLTNSPPGAAINPTNGLFAWTPDASQAPSTNAITVTVTDNGSPNQSAARSFTVEVMELRVGTLSADTNGVTLSWSAIAGQSFGVQYKDSLSEPNWTDLAGDIVATNGVAIITDPAVNQQRFYRLVLVQ